MVVFAVAVFVSFVYLIGNGALDWGPVQALAGATTSRAAAAPLSRRCGGSAVDAGEAA